VLDELAAKDAFSLAMSVRNDLGCTLPDHERQKAATRLLQPRIDGERPAQAIGAQVSNPASSGIAIRRWRSGDAHGRRALTSAIERAGEDHRFQNDSLAFVELE